MTERLLLHERTRSDGALEKTWLEVEEGTLFLCIDGEPKTAVPLEVLDGVMRRYGKPLADDVAVDGARLFLGDRELAVLRYRPYYDVIAKDYFVLTVPEQTPLAELATAVAAALAFLLRRAEIVNQAPADEVAPRKID